ncbi:hypothetical protein LWI29_030457 [Acer saccharum]|uniref:RPW8 domain-containing protein n=1 Tax=Acer saccharum TaxID=4024 RepID=A0AA39W6U6_ACESA|nr:hypothetical protein LWI29_030457 [Acer saccharum]
MADLFGGAMLGAFFGELLKVVTEAKNISDEYETELAKLKSTLESIKPIIQEIETLNIALNIPEQETAQLKEELIKGTELVRKCSKGKCCCFKKVNYADKLNNLNQSIERFIKVNMQAQMVRDNKKILVEVDMQTELIKDNKKILEQVEERGANMQTDDKKILEQVEEIRVNIQTELITDNKKILEQVEVIGKKIDRDGGVSNRVELMDPVWCLILQ